MLQHNLNKMYLKRFTVENYKNFKKPFTLDFSDVRDYGFNRQCLTGRVIKNAIVYGKNSMGKTNFSHAMMDITYHLVDKTRSKKALYNYKNADSMKTPAIFTYVFDCDGRELIYEYQKTSATHLLKEKMTLDGRQVVSADYNMEEMDLSHLREYDMDVPNWNYRDEETSIIRYMAYSLSLSEEHFLSRFMNFVTGMLWFCSLDSSNTYVGLSLGSESITDYIIEEDLVEDYNIFLREYGIDERVEAVEETDGHRRLCFVHEDALLPFYTASSGTKALTTFYYWYKHKNKIKFLVIDEFDAFYHFELAEKIVHLLETKLDIQVVLTSHNTNLLSNKIMRPDCYFILNKSRMVSFANATQRELKEGHNLEKLYMSGEFDE